MATLRLPYSVSGTSPRTKQTFDILVTDLNIGEPGDGFTVVSAIRRMQPDAAALIITGFPAFDNVLQAIRQQVND
jgi:YesN/AraC family two-component response regulator